MTSLQECASDSVFASPQAVIKRAQEIIGIEIEGLQTVQSQLDLSFVRAVQLLKNCQGRVIITGMGKSGLIGKKIAATMSSTGTPALFLHPAEGSHGDFGSVTAQDVIIAISNSGETPELLSILPLIKRFEIPLIAMTGQLQSTLSERADVVLNIAVPQEACSLGLAPTSSTTATLAMGDALAVVLLEEKQFTENDFALFHPAGALGKKLLLTVTDLMHTGDSLPLVDTNASFIDALLTMSEKHLGVAIILDTNKDCLGVLTDGDVRRALMKYRDVHQIELTAVLTKHPKTIESSALVVSALKLMQEHKITVLLVLDKQQKPCGLLHMHDILRAGIS